MASYAGAAAHNSPSETDFHSEFQFPYHQNPRTWFITAGTLSPGLLLAEIVLEHGDNVVLGVPPAIYDELQNMTAVEKGGGAIPGKRGLDQPLPRHEGEQFRQFLLSLDRILDVSDNSPSTEGAPPSPKSRDSNSSKTNRQAFQPVRLDPRSPAQCQAAVAMITEKYGSLDILVCNSTQVVAGTIEELGASEETLALMREQMETVFFSNVNAIKAAIPAMRNSDKGGHIVVPTGITGHLGTPGLGAFCSAGWALEGYCDSLAYEVAPFNIKVSIIQTTLECIVLPHEIRAPPLLPQYAPPSHAAPLARNVIGGLLDTIYGVERGQDVRRDSTATDLTSGSDDIRPIPQTLGSSTSISVQESKLPHKMLHGMLRETLFSICAIGGHPNPPQRHIVSVEGVIGVKEKLKTVSVELEEFIQASSAVDFIQEE